MHREASEGGGSQAVPLPVMSVAHSGELFNFKIPLEQISE